MTSNQSSNAYIIVKFDNLIKYTGVGDLKNYFKIEIDDKTIYPISASANHPKFKGLIAIKIKNTDVPKLNQNIKVSYINNNKKRGLVNFNTAEKFQKMKRKVAPFTITNKDSIFKSTDFLDKPMIKKIEAKDEDGGTSIYVDFTNGRDISNNSDISLNFYVTITPNPKGTDVISDTFLCKSETTEYKNQLRLIFQNQNASIQSGSIFDISYEEVGSRIIKDQFGLTIHPFNKLTDIKTINNSRIVCNNLIKNPIFHSGWVNDKTPNNIIVIFKKPGEQHPININMVGISGNSSDWGAGNYQIRFTTLNRKSYQYFDVSNIEIITVKKTESDILMRDISGLKLTLESFSIPPQSSMDSNIGFYWNSNNLARSMDSTIKKYKLTDEYGNDLFNSEHDPLSGRQYGLDVSSCRIKNYVKGIDYLTSTIKATTDNIWDNCFSSVIYFTKKGDNKNILPVNDTLRTSCNDFTFKNKTTGRDFSVDGYKITDSSNIEVWINYNTNDFTKVINKGDIVEFFYTPPLKIWPTTIKDSNGVYLIETELWTNEVYHVFNAMEFSGNFLTEGSPPYILASNSKYIYMTLDVDICNSTIENLTSDQISNAFTIDIYNGQKVGYVPDISYAIQKIYLKKKSNRTIVLELNHLIWAPSCILPKVQNINISYNNNGIIGMRNKYGLKINNSKKINIPTSNIKAPGENICRLSTKYKKKQSLFNKFDNIIIYIDPPVNINLCNKMNLSGWKYAVNWYNNNPLYSTTPAKFGYEFTHNNFHYINIPKENIKIGENGSIIILETKFNKTDTSKNMCGFTKTHTKSVNNIRLWYDPPKSSGILGKTGLFNLFTKNAIKIGSNYDPTIINEKKNYIELLNNNNNILDVSINFMNLGYDGSTSLPVSSDINAVMTFQEYPNNIYIRVQQPDYSGNDIWWHDIYNINLSEILNTNFTINYDNIDMNIKNISPINSNSDWTNNIIPSLLKKYKDARWICITTDNDFIPKIGYNQKFCKITYNNPTPPAGIIDSNGSILDGFSNNKLLNSTIKWCNMSIDNFAPPKIGFGMIGYAPKGLEQTINHESNKEVWLWPKNWLGSNWGINDKIFQYLSYPNNGINNLDPGDFKIIKAIDNSIVAVATKIIFNFDMDDQPLNNYIKICFDIPLVTDGPWGNKISDWEKNNSPALKLSYTKPPGRRGIIVGKAGTQFTNWEWICDFSIILQNDFIQNKK